MSSQLPSVLLSLERDIPRQRRRWVWQRVGWTVMALVVVAAAVGLLGEGRLSRRVVEIGDAAIEYHSIVRIRAPSQFLITAKPNGQDRVRIGMGRALVDVISIQHIEPTPVESARDSSYLWLTFEGRPTTVISIQYEPQRWGKVEWALERTGTERATISQVVLP